MKQRSGNVDFAKFIAALLIMAHHIYHIGVAEYPFYEAWIYVEFFLLITGYYTAKHYAAIHAENPSKNAFEYTIKKFMPLIPYTSIATLLGWITQGILGVMYSGWTWQQFLTNFAGDFAFDILLISDSYTHPLIAPLWYVSTMLIVFPLFCLLVQIKNRYTKILICLLYPLLYFGWSGMTGNGTFPHNMLRVLADMMLGVAVYEFSILFKEYIHGLPKMFLTSLEVMAFLYPICSCYGNFAAKGYTTTRVYVLCFFVFLLLDLPGFSYTTKIKGRVFTYLGRLSMPVFIIHWYIGTLTNVFGNNYNWNGNQRIIVYYFASVVSAMVLMFVIDRAKKWNELLNKEFTFAD